MDGPHKKYKKQEDEKKAAPVKDLKPWEMFNEAGDQIVFDDAADTKKRPSTKDLKPWEMFNDKGDQIVFDDDGLKPREKYQKQEDEANQRALALDSEALLPAVPTKAESLGRGLAQGATLGFGDELSAAVGSLIPTDTDKALGRGIGDRYTNIKETLRGENQAAAEANPITSALGEITGMVPGAIATGAGGLARQVAAAGGTGALASLGASKDQSFTDASKEAGKTGALAAGLAFVLGGAFKIGTKVTSAVTKNAKESFKLSYDLEKSLSDPAVARQIGQQIDDVGAKFQSLSQTSRNTIGEGLDNLASKTLTPVDIDPVIKEIADKIGKFNPGRNALAQGAKNDLNDALTKISQDLFREADEAGKVPFSVLHDVKKQLSQMVYEQGLYSDSPYVEKLAKNLYSGVSRTLKQADKSGQYGELSKVYSALSSSDPEAFTANALKYLQDPWDLNARGRLGKLLGDMDKLAPDMKKLYTPELSAFIEKDFQNAAIKAEVLKKVGGKTGALALKGFPLPNPSALASDAGAYLGASPVKPAMTVLGDVASSARGMIPLEGPLAARGLQGLNVIGSNKVANK